ncbi:MAG: hypothetical protein GY795_07990, partial [Desulfobacterales bacterium]|nr:hypothetical protein [Desulfobacterales bacterium]
YTLYTSATTVDEIEELDNTEKRQNIMDIIFDYHVNILELSEEAVILAIHLSRDKLNISIGYETISWQR